MLDADAAVGAGFAVGAAIFAVIPVEIEDTVATSVSTIEFESNPHALHTPFPLQSFL